MEWYDFLETQFCPFKKCLISKSVHDHADCVKRFVLLWPRGHAKTECTTINYVSWLVGNHPDIHVNIVSKTASLANDILLALITRFENDEKYIEVFGRLRPKDPKRWTSESLIVQRDEISKNPTIKATGMMGPITGGRNDVIILDDGIDEENVRTRLQFEKASLWFNKVLYPTLYPWGGIVVLGTRWHYADLYSDLLKTWPNQIKKSIQPDGSILWPDYWSKEKLEERHKQVGTVIFNLQYQNDPTGLEGDLLKSEWLHEYDVAPPSRCFNTAGVDPALGEGDNQAIATLATDPMSRQAYLTDVWCERLSFPLFLKKLQHLHDVNNYQRIYFEANAFQKVLSFLPELQNLPIVPVQTTKNKELRFIPMSSHFEAKRVLVNPLLNIRTEFWNEWVQFPRGEHDDALDATEIVCRQIKNDLPLEVGHVMPPW